MRTSDSADLYFQKLLGAEDKAFQKARESSDDLQKSAISVSRIEGELLRFFVERFACQKFVEIGTLTGYSALWILKGLGANGKLWTFEKDSKHAEKARATLQDFPQAQVLEGDAETELPKIADQGPFDGIFIDGNKSAYGRYLDWAEKNLKKGGLILADNVFLSGGVWGASPSHFSKSQIEAMKSFNERLSDTRNFKSLIVPTSDGLFVAEKLK